MTQSSKLFYQPFQENVIHASIKRYFGHVSGLKLLSASFAILCIVSVLLTSTLLLSAAGSVVDRVLLKATNQAQRATQNEIEYFLKTPDVLLEYVLDAIDHGYVDSSDVESMQALLWDTPGRGDLIAFSSIYYATPEGEILGLGSRQMDWPLLNWTFSLSTAETEGHYTVVKPTPDGRLSARRKRLSKYDARQRPWFKAATHSGGPPAWSELYVDFESGRTSLSRAQVSIDDNGRVQGVAGVDMHIRHLQNFLRALPLSNNGEMFLVDPDGLLLAATAPWPASVTSYQGKLVQESSLRFSKLAAQHLVKELGGFSRVDSPYKSDLVN